MSLVDRFSNIITEQITATIGGFIGNVTGNVTGTHIGGQQDSVTVISGDGAVAVAPGTTALTKGSAAAITIAAPTATTHDGYLVRIYSETAFAHVITSGVRGFNGKASSGTVTFSAAKGNTVVLVARNGDWWVVTNIGGTVA